MARNLSLPFLARTQRFGFIDRRTERRRAVSAIGRFGIVAAGPDAEVRTLSGGNQQTVVVGRWLTPEARLLLLDEPFAGIDLGARTDIGQRLRESAGGRATLAAFGTNRPSALGTALGAIFIGVLLNGLTMANLP